MSTEKLRQLAEDPTLERPDVVLALISAADEIDQLRADLIEFSKTIEYFDAQSKRRKAERDFLRAQVAAVEALCVVVENRMMTTAKPSEIRAALSGSVTPTDPPKCEHGETEAHELWDDSWDYAHKLAADAGCPGPSGGQPEPGDTEQ